MRIDAVPFRGRFYDVLRATFLVKTGGPRHLRERLTGEELPVRAIQDVPESVAVRPQDNLTHPPLILDVREYGHLRRVVVEDIVRRELEVPLHHARIGIERDD